MAKITTHRYKRYDVFVSYDVRRTRFYIKLPEELAHYETDGKVWGDKQEDVERGFDQIVNTFIKEGAERKKFIAIEALDDARCEDEFVRAKGTTGFLKLQWAIVEQVMINGEVQYRYKTGEPGTWGADREYDFYQGSRIVFIPWTEKREAFLKRTTDAVQEMAKNVHEFMSSEHLGTLIDERKTTLLLTKRGS